MARDEQEWKDVKGKEKIIRFGDANMTIKKNNPARRRSFRARHRKRIIVEI